MWGWNRRNAYIQLQEPTSHKTTETKIAYIQLQSRLPLMSPTLPFMLVIQDLWVDTMGRLALWLVSPVGRARVDARLLPIPHPVPRTLILHQNHAPQFSLVQT